MTRSTSYEYDSNDNIAKITDETGKSVNFTYDGRDMLSSVTSCGDTFSFAYDGNGNMKLFTDPWGRSMQYGYDGYYATQLVNRKEKERSPNEKLACPYNEQIFIVSG